MTMTLKPCKGTTPPLWPLGVPGPGAAAPISDCLLPPPQIKRRASEALPELLRPVTPITSFEGSQSQDHSGIFGLVSNLEELEVDDWEF